MPFQTQNGKLLIKRTKPVDAAECCCCPTPEGVELKYSAGPNGTEYHCCDCAIFKCYADDVFIGAVNLNNGPDCPDKTVNLTISAEQAQQIIANRSGSAGSSAPVTDCCILNVRLECDGEALDPGCVYAFGGAGCHSSAADLEIRNKDGKLVFDGQVGEATIAVDICREIRDRYVCDPSVGCRVIRTQTNTGFETPEECAEACIAYYTCSPPTGCELFGYYTEPQAADFSSIEDCNAACLPRYDFCDPYFGCWYTGYATTGNTLEQCQANCTIKSYTCDVNGGCEPRYDLSGEFTSLPACSAACVVRYACVNYESCQYVGYYTTGLTQAECEETCIAPSYKCETSGCQPLGDETGDYETRADCEAACLLRYTCEYYGCAQQGYAATGQTFEQCIEACLPTYQCAEFYYDGINYSSCEFAGHVTSGANSFEQCCAEEPCASSFYCAQQFSAFQMPPVENMTAIAAPTQAVQSPEITSTENAGTPDPIYDSAFLPRALQLCGPRTAKTKAIQLGLLKEKSDAPPEHSNIFVAPTTPVLAHTQFITATPTPRRALTLEEQAPFGPGTFLTKMLEKIGIKSSPTCACKARARVMNDKGNDWCEQNIATIVGWLREEATKRKLLFVDLAGKLLVRRAIKLSRAALAKAEQQCDEPDTSPLDSNSQASAG